MRILFTSPVLEHPAAGGPQLRIENSIKALARVSEIDIISRSPPSITGGDSATTFFKQYCTEYHLAPSARSLSANRYVRKLQTLASDALGTAVRRDLAFFIDHIERREIDLVWFGYGNISYPLISALKRRFPKLKMVCDTDSVWSRFILRELPYARGIRRLQIARAGAKKEREEREWVRLCDLTTAVSAVDADYYRSIAPSPDKVAIFSNVIDVETYANPPGPPADFRRPSIFLAGTFGHYHSPMDTAARWMLEDVLPIVRQLIPDAHFYIVGNRSDMMFGHVRDPNVTVTGKLPSVLPYLCNVDVSVVPLKFESGTRFKILEAGACSIPIVSTTLGAEGIDVADGAHLLLADDAPGFAEAICRIIVDKTLAARLAGACNQLVVDRYSVDQLEREAKLILEQLAR